MNDRPEAVFCIPDISDWILRTGKKGISYVFHQTKFRFKIKAIFNEEIATETQTKNDKKRWNFIECILQILHSRLYIIFEFFLSYEVSGISRCRSSSFS